MKSILGQWLKAQGYQAEDLGPESTDSVDYPDYANRLAEAMAQHPESQGVLMCGSGIGMSIAANRYRHLRAALVQTPEQARLSRQHNNANVLVLGARMLSDAEALECLESFLATAFEGGRHSRRVEKLK
jgi:ribose 5-phosphate isomerase B